MCGSSSTAVASVDDGFILQNGTLRNNNRKQTIRDEIPLPVHMSHIRGRSVRARTVTAVMLVRGRRPAVAALLLRLGGAAATIGVAPTLHPVQQRAIAFLARDYPMPPDLGPVFTTTCQVLILYMSVLRLVSCVAALGLVIDQRGLPDYPLNQRYVGPRAPTERFSR